MGLFAQIRRFLTPGKSPGFAFTAEPCEIRREGHSFNVRIPESIGPMERSRKYGDPLEEALRGIGEVTGGGSQMGEGNTIAYCDINLEVVDRERGLEIIRTTLRACGAPAGTVIEEYEPEYKELPL